MTGDNDDAVFLPGPVDPPYASVNIAQAVPIEKPGRQGKLLTQFFHPLSDETAGRNQQHAIENTAYGERAQHQPRFDGFPKAHLVTKEKGLRKCRDSPLPHLRLMWERL